MNIPYKTVSVLVLHFGLMGICTHVSAAEQPELWQKAVRIASESRWLPGEVHEHEQVFSKKGKLEEETETLMILQRSKNGEILMSIVKNLKNGKDVTEKARKEHNIELSGSVTIEELMQMEENPFLPELQAQLEITPLEQEKTLNGKRCAAFRYVYDANFPLLSKAQDFRFEGIAWLAEGSGAPYKLEYELTQGLPVEEEGFKITSVKETARYGYSAEGDWYALQSVSDSDFEMNAFLVKFKGRSHEVSTYSRHWRY